MSGEGARRHGGRFNRRGIPTLYTSLTPLTAIREAQPLGRPMQPLVLCAYEVDVEPVFDSMEAAQRLAMGVSESDLSCPTWEAEMYAGEIPASQALAERLIAASYAGMRVRSFARAVSADDFNLVIWKWGSRPPVRVALIDDEGRLADGQAD